MKSKHSTFKKKTIALSVSMLLSAMGVYTLSSTPLFADSTAPISNTPITVAATLPNLATMIKKNRSAVVNISVKSKEALGQVAQGSQGYNHRLDKIPPELREFFNNIPRMPQMDGRKVSSQGSGFLISSEGLIVTNAHVVNNATKITVSLADKRKYEAEVIGVDKLSDIALLKIEATKLPYVSLGDSDKLDVGQWVVAIGAPFGLDYTATQGIVSALSRSLPTETYVPFIQTDAAVNPGNSGGPLFDLAGNVIGVNSQIFSKSGGYMGVSFAIPINIVKNVTEQLKSTGKVSRGWLGVGIQNVNQSLAKSFGMDDTKGSLIASVLEDSPAKKAGLKVGDVIISFDNKTVESSSHLPLLVGNTPVGKEVPVKVIRAGQEKTLNVTINKLAGKDDKPVLASLEKGSLGVAVSPLTSGEKAKFDNKINGVMIEKVLQDSPAENAGLQTGDVIVSVGGKQIDSPKTLKNIIQQTESEKPLAILLQRGDQAMFVAVDLNS